MKICRLELENFQSHVNSVLELDGGLNVITGPSDNGKSAIIRALKWLFIGEPTGDCVVRKGCDTTRVTAIFEDGTILTRERSKGKNRYLLQSPGQETPDVYEGFGSKIPSNIVALHGVRKVSFDGNKKFLIPIADQMEGPFLLDEPGSMKAKAIGRLSRVNIVDTAIQIVSKNIQDSLGDQKRTKDEITILEKELEEFQDLDKKKKQIQSVRAIVNEMLEKEKRYGLLIQTSDEYEKIIEEIKVAEKNLKVLANAQLAKDLMDNVNAIFLKLIDLDSLAGDFFETCDSISEQEKVLESVKGSSLAKTIVLGAEETLTRLKQLTALSVELGSVEKRIDIVKSNLNSLSHVSTAKAMVEGLKEGLKRQEALREFKARYDEILGEEKKFRRVLTESTKERLEAESSLQKIFAEQKVCPLCGGVLGSSALEHLVGHAG